VIEDRFGLDVVRRLVIHWIMGLMVIGNRKPYALERYGHSSTRYRRQAPVANPTGYFGLLAI
jgi:hypothetical protein